MPKNIELKDLKNILANLSKKLGWFFLLFFLILLGFEILEANKSVQIVLDANKEPQIVTKQQGVRIDFINYEKVIFRKEQAQSFEPSSEAVVNPFN